MTRDKFSILFVIVFLGTALVANAGSPRLMSGGRNYAQPVVQDISPEIKLIKFGNGVQVEQLRGNAASAHLQNLIARHPKAFAESRKDMARRGFHPTNTVFVERTYRDVSNRSQHPTHPYELVQTSNEQNSDGEIVFWSYDGPGDSWQGSIYMEVYSDGAASMWNGQIDTTSQDYPYNWVENTWSYGGDDGPDTRTALPNHPPLPGNISRIAGVQFASWKPGQGALLVTFNWYNWSTCWRAGVVGGCTTAAVGCLRSAAAWPACFGLWCVGAEIGTGLACAIAN
jgi:hypothetical protein